MIIFHKNNGEVLSMDGTALLFSVDVAIEFTCNNPEFDFRSIYDY
jgi:hypothetical protein